MAAGHGGGAAWRDQPLLVAGESPPSPIRAESNVLLSVQCPNELRASAVSQRIELGETESARWRHCKTSMLLIRSARAAREPRSASGCPLAAANAARNGKRAGQGARPGRSLGQGSATSVQGSASSFGQRATRFGLREVSVQDHASAEAPAS
jgi:hypothetical protein